MSSALPPKVFTDSQRFSMGGRKDQFVSERVEHATAMKNKQNMIENLIIQMLLLKISPN